MTVKRTTQVVAEALSQSDPKMRATQVVVESISSNALKLIVTQVIAEMVSENVPDDVGGNIPIQLVTAT